MTDAEFSSGWREVYRWAACDPDAHEEPPKEATAALGVRPAAVVLAIALVLALAAVDFVLSGGIL
jgi:hypothetical protein